MAASIIPELLELFPDTIIIEPYLGEDAYGKEQYGGPVQARGKVVGRVRLAADQDGQEHTSIPQITLAGCYGATALDRYTLPARFSSDPKNPGNIRARQPKALAVDRSTDENGPHHETVHFSDARPRSF